VLLSMRREANELGIAWMGPLPAFAGTSVAGHDSVKLLTQIVPAPRLAGFQSPADSRDRVRSNWSKWPLRRSHVPSSRSRRSRSKTLCCVDIANAEIAPRTREFEIGFRPTPIGVQESVGAIMREQEPNDLHLSETLAVIFDGGADGPALVYDFRKVIPRQPHSGILIVPGKNDAASRNTRHFAHPRG